MALGYLLDPFIQIQNDNGTPIVGAKIYVYNADTTNLATTYRDFEGHLNTNPIITDDLGNATIIADDGIEYDVSVHDENDLLLFTKKNISIDKTSSAGGNIQVAPGYGVTVEKVGNVFTVSVDTDLIATKEDLNDKQDKLTGGENIEITNDNKVNVVNRKELVTQYPLKINRTNDRVKIYLDSDFSDEFKTKQTPVEYGGAVGNYISYIAQNVNGEIEATVQETVFPTFDNMHAGDNIFFVRTANDLTISSKDWTSDITSAVSGKLDTSTFTDYSAAHASDDVTPYTAGANINITNHVVSGKDWTSDITSAVSGKLDTSTYNTFVTSTDSWDKTAYSGGTGISVSNHAISVDSTIATKNELSRSAQIDKTYTITHTVASDEAHWICFDVKQCFRDYRSYIYSTIPNAFDYTLSPVIMYISGSFSTNISNNGFCYVGIRPAGVEPLAEPAARQVVYISKISNSDFTPKPSEYGKGAFYSFGVESSKDIMDIMPAMSSVWFDLALIDSSQTIWHTGDTFTWSIRFISTVSYRKTHVS